MRIAYLSVSDQLGGSEIALLEMIKGVRRLRPSWALQAILPGRGPLLDRLEAVGADCVVLPLPASLARLGESGAHPVALAAGLVPVALALPAYLHRLRKILAASRPALLHTNGLKAHIVGARAGEPSKIVWHMHEYIGARRVTRALLARHQRHVAAMIANSKSVAADLAAALRPSAPVHVVYNAVDLDAFAPDGPAEDLDRRAGLRAGAWRRCTCRPGVDVRALEGTRYVSAGHGLDSSRPAGARLHHRRPLYDTTGSQHSLEELQALADRLRLSGRVGFTGFLPAAPAMRALDIVVHASTRPEPFGMVIAEAMACGRAVITSGSGGAAELIDAGVDALTHVPGDAEDLSRCIVQLAGDAELRRQLGSRARAAACRRFDSERQAREMVAVYEAIAE